MTEQNLYFMDKSAIKKRIEKLKQEIEKYRHAYHVLDKSLISDSALDSLKNELLKLETEQPEFITPDSPTQRVAGKPLEQFNKVRHSLPMMSLFDAFSPEDMRDWEKRMKKILASDNPPNPPPRLAPGETGLYQGGIA